MAIARVQGIGGNSGATNPATFPRTFVSPVAAGNTVCGFVTWDHSGGATLTSVTDDKGNTYNLESTVTDNPDNQSSAAFSLNDITNGPTVITAHFSTNAGGIAMVIDEFSGCSAVSSDQRDGTAHGGQVQTNPGTGTDAITSGNFTTATNGDLIYGVACATSVVDQAISTGTGFTTATNSGSSGGLCPEAFSEWKVQATAGAGTAATFTTAAGTQTYTPFMIAIKAAVVVSNAPPVSWGYFDKGPAPRNSANQLFSAFQPQGAIVSQSALRVGASRFFDSGPPPRTAALQRFDAWTPEKVTQAAATVPQGWKSFFDSAKIFLRANLTDIPLVVPTTQIITTMASGFDQNDVSRIRLTDPGKHPFSAFQPRGAIIANTTTPQGWARFFDSAAVPKGAAIQAWSAHQPQGGAKAPWGWTAYVDAARTPASAALQMWAGFEPFGTVSPAAFPWGWSDYFDTGTRPPDASRQAWSAFAPFGSPPVPAAPWGWGAYFDAGSRPPTAAQQPWAAFQPQGTIVSITPQGGWAQFYDSGRKPGTAANQPFSFMAPYQPPLPTGTPGPLGWARFFDSGPKPPTAALQQWAAYPVRFVISTTPQGWPQFFDSGPPPMSAARQPFAAFQPRGTIAPPPAPYGWSTFIDSGPAPATAARQPWAAFQPQGGIVSTTPQGWARFFDNGPPAPSASRQPWAAFQPRGNVPLPPQPNGWTSFFDVGAAPSTAARQRWEAFQPQGFIFVPRAIAVWGWADFFDSGPAPSSAALQKWEAWTPQVIIRTTPVTQIGCIVQGRACDCGQPHHPLRFFPGATWQIQGNLLYADGTPFNLGPGCQIMWAMDDAEENRVLYLTLGNGITVLDAEAGTCMLTVTPAMSRTVPLGSYVDQLRAVDPTGYVSDQWTGAITVSESFFT